MVDQVARALCDAAGRSTFDALGKEMAPVCIVCQGGECEMWMCFRQEARAAISAAHKWHKKERRWPSFCK